MGMMQLMLGMAPMSLPAKTPGPAALPSRFDQMLDALNRLPRPLMALGTLSLLANAMLDPAGFASRMAALDDIPEPLWWLMGGVITFYFGARETHYLRKSTPASAQSPDTKA